MNEYEGMSEEQVLALVEELKGEIIYAIRKVKESERNAKNRESRWEEAKKEEDIETLSEIYEEIKKETKEEILELKKINSEHNIPGKRQQLKDILRSYGNSRIGDYALAALLVIAAELYRV